MSTRRYPVIFLLPRPEKSSRLILIFRPFMMIPVVFWGALYGFVAQMVGVISFWAVLILGSYPQTLWEFCERYFRFNMQINAYSSLLTDVYPSFNGKPDNGYPVRVQLERPERSSRLYALFRFLLLLPQVFFAIGYGLVIGFVYMVLFWVVLFIGRIPDGFWGLISRYFIWSSRLTAYSMLLVDEYPPFNGLQPLSSEEEVFGRF